MDDEEFSDVDVFGAIPTEFVAEEGEVESVAPLLQNSNEDSHLEGLDYGLEDSFVSDCLGCAFPVQLLLWLLRSKLFWLWGIWVVLTFQQAGDADDFDDVATFIQKLQVNHANTK